MSDTFFSVLSDLISDRKTLKRPYLKLSSTKKETLAKAKEANEDRLRDDYKKVREHS